MTTYGIGTLARLSIAVRDATGTPVDPVSISLGVLLPDGDLVGPYTTTSDPAVVQDGTGLYHLDFPTIQAGSHVAHWDAVSPTVTDDQPFEVEPLWAVGITSLEEAKLHLKKRITSTEDDEKLQGFILAATSMIEDRMGHVLPVTLVETVRIFRGKAVLHDRPVIEVISVGGLAEADWECSAEGVLELSTTAATALVMYRAGRQPIPHRFRLASKELIAHLWRTSQTNQDGGRPQLQGEIQVDNSSAFALPYNVRQLLGLNKAQRDMPAIG
jgi:hypothetical protein